MHRYQRIISDGPAFQAAVLKSPASSLRLRFLWRPSVSRPRKFHRRLRRFLLRPYQRTTGLAVYIGGRASTRADINGPYGMRRPGDPAGCQVPPLFLRVGAWLQRGANFDACMD